MDSDDNCLVIDEAVDKEISESSMEVDKTPNVLETIDDTQNVVSETPNQDEAQPPADTPSKTPTPIPNVIEVEAITRENSQDAIQQDAVIEEAIRQDESAQDDVPPQNDTPQKDAPQEDAPQEDAPQKDTPQKDTPQKDAPQKDTPQSDTPQKTTPRSDGSSKSKEKKTPKVTKEQKIVKNYTSDAKRSIRLTQDIIQSKMLNITAQKHQIHNMRFTYREGLLCAEIPSIYPATLPFGELLLEQLLNWPDIKITITLNHVTCVHEVKENGQLDLVFGDDELVGINKDMNPTHTRYLQNVASSKTYPVVSKVLLQTYVTSMMKTAPLYDVGPSKLPEIKHTFAKIIDNVGAVPSETVQTRVTHSRFMNKYKYYRVFDNGFSNTGGKVQLRETINPEVNFNITQCAFTTDQMAISVVSEELEDYFRKVFGKKGPLVLESTRDRFKRCITLKCEKCNDTFDGALWSVKLKDHIYKKHFVDKKWTCMDCKQTFEQLDLLLKGWKHDCNT